MKRILSSAALLAFTFGALPAAADTAQDCIADYQTAKTLFDSTSPLGELNCVRLGNSLNRFQDGTLPEACTGSHREWHLEAKAIANGKDYKGGGKCIVRLHGGPGEGCGIELKERDLSVSDAAQWRNFLNKECKL